MFILLHLISVNNLLVINTELKCQLHLYMLISFIYYNSYLLMIFNIYFYLRASTDTLPGRTVSRVALLQHVYDTYDVAQENSGQHEVTLQTARHRVPLVQ